MLRPFAIFIVLFSFGGLISCNASAENQSNSQTCPELYAVSGCATRTNCSTVDCALHITGESVGLSVYITRCSGTVIIANSTGGIHVFGRLSQDVETIEVSGSEYGMQLRVSRTDHCGLFWLKVELLIGEDLAKSRFAVRQTVLFGLFTKSTCSRELQDYGCDKDPTNDPFLPPEADLPLQLWLLPVMMVSQIVTCLCCCYHFQRRRRSAATDDEGAGRGAAATIRDLVTIRIPDIPMQQLVNETEGSPRV